jgi:hypothetical protein
VSERKPPGVSWETWTERKIREAQQHGRFDNLPGYGKPIPDLDKPYDDLWWVKDKLRRERLSTLPPTLALRKEVEDVLDNLADIPSEDAVRRTVERLNEQIVHVNRTAISGPPLRMGPLDPDAVVAQWARTPRPEAEPPPVAPEPVQRVPRWWRRRRRVIND